MADNQALNATFFAFRKREKGGVILGATIAFAVLMFAASGLFIFLNLQAFSDYVSWTATIAQSAGAADPNDPNALAAMMPPQSVMSALPGYLLLTIFIYLLLASYEAACLRWMVRGETKGLFGLALDGDTLRVYFTYWLWFFLGIAVYVVMLLAAGGVITGMVMGSQGGAEPNALIALVPLVIVLVLFALLVFFGVRFAPAAATSIAKRRFAFFDAWTVTKGRFWALLGSFVLLYLIFFVVYFIVAISLGVAMGAMAMSQVGMAEPKTAEEAFRAFANPQWFAGVGVVIVVMMFASFLFYIALFGVNARAAQAALEDGKIQPAEG